jgi:vacuolar-type H+-ATPase subunit D/Vma8
MKSISQKWDDLIAEIKKCPDDAVRMAKQLQKDIDSLVVDLAVAGFSEHIDQTKPE